MSGFEGFKWEHSKEWNAYLETLFPTPEQQVLEKFKRKWYKANIDSTFQISNNNATNKPPVPSLSSRLHYPVMILLVLGVMSSLVSLVRDTSRRYATTLLLFGFVLELIGASAPFHFRSIAFWAKLSENESAQNILMCLGTMGISSALGLVSPCVGAVLSVSQKIHSVIPAALTPYFARINSERYSIMKWRANMEIVFGCLIFHMLFSKKNGVTPMNVFIYWNMLRIKGHTNGFTQYSFRQVDNYITKFLTRPFMPSFCLSAYATITRILIGSRR